MSSEESLAETKSVDGWYWWRESIDDDWEIVELKDGLLYERILANTQGDWVIEPTSYIRGFFNGPIIPPSSIELG